MKKIIATLSSMALAATALVTPVAPAAAVAAPQFPAGSITCEAKSPFAVGLWNHYNQAYACQRALQECALRTPAGYMCYVTRWWYN